MLSALIAAAALQTASLGHNLKSDVQILRENDQALLDALAPGEHSIWERLLTRDSIYVDENGAVMHREEFLKTLKPLPAGVAKRICGAI